MVSGARSLWVINKRASGHERAVRGGGAYLLDEGGKNSRKDVIADNIKCIV